METKVRQLIPALVLLVSSVSTSVKADAQPYYQAHADQYHHYHHYCAGTHRTYFQQHPKVRAAAMGAGVGTAAGAVTGLVTGRGVLRGAVIGAGTGAGVGLIRSSHTLRRHPIVRDIATGSAVGWGLGYAGGSHHGTAARTTAVGAAAGLATGLLTHGI